MNIELYEGQIARVYITLEGETDVYKVYGGTSKGQFHAECNDDMHWFLDVPAELTVGCSIPRYDIFAKRVSTGHEWRILSGKITTLKRQSQADGECFSPREYHVTVKVVEGVEEVTGSSVLIGLRGEKGEKGDKGDKGDPGDGNVTAEAIQAVMPVAWKGYSKATAQSLSVAIGNSSNAALYSVSIGDNSQAGESSTVVGNAANAYNSNSSVFGYNASTNRSRTVTVGAMFYESVDGVSTKHTCTTEGTGSITIGAGANTLNNGTTESSNSITIGCKASNSGADSVVIGAGASNANGTSIVIGTAAKSLDTNVTIVGNNATANTKACAIGHRANASFHSIAIGYYTQATNTGGVAIGNSSQVGKHALSIGSSAKSTANNSIAIGTNAKVSDLGTTVIRSTASDGTYTQLYFSGANTPLANTYHDGAPMLGYVTKDSAGNIVAAGTRSLIDLLTDNSTFAPASLDENGEWVAPTVFHPSDLDLPVEEPSEEEYTPMPVYPIVEPELSDELSEEEIE